MVRRWAVRTSSSSDRDSAASALRRAWLDVDVDVTIIDANNFHTFQPLLYQVATAGLDADDIGFPIRGIFRRNQSVRFVLGEVNGIDLRASDGHRRDGRTFGYDYLVIAAGTISTSFGIEGVDDNTFPLKTLHDALRLRAHLLARFETASAHAGAPVDLGIVVVGGGPTGVEMAGGLRELIDQVFAQGLPRPRSARRLRSPSSRQPTECSDRSIHRCPNRPPRSLRRRNIDVELGVGVDHVEPGTVVLSDGRRISAGTIIWAAGVTASPVAGLLGVDLGRGGRIPVGDDLSLAGHPNVFAIGDIALPPGDPLPQVAQPAIQGGNSCRRADRRHAWPADRPRALPLPRQGFDGDDRSKPGRGRVPQRPAVPRLHRLADVAGPAPDRADGLPQPRQRLRQLGLELPHLRPRLPPPPRPA